MDAEGRPQGGDPGAVVEAFAIDLEGRVSVKISDGMEFVRGQVLLQDFREPFMLAPTGANLFTNLTAAMPFPLAVERGTRGLGTVQSGALELPPEITPLFPPSRQGRRVRITGEPGGHWRLEATTNFVDWIVMTTVTNSPEETEITDPASRILPHNWYRVAVQTP